MDVGEKIQVDVVVGDIPEPDGSGDGTTWSHGGLHSFALLVTYDSEVLRVTDSDARMMIEANQRSLVYVEGDRPPDSDGSLYTAVIDSWESGLESGNGVLARITFEAVAPGESSLGIADSSVSDPWGAYVVDDARDARVVVGGVCE
ncbi:MAG TPA: hypothetical protein VGR43_08085 [Dehalococcoidia bacterium]|jgi:hypothetical protein|nr:hypothetical protein [Dehalococcoidia bacterium]